MKKYLAIILQVAIIPIIFAGCTKTLEEKPRTFISPANFFTNPDSYESAVMGIYANLPLYEPMLQEMCTDIYGAPSGSYEQALPTYQNAPQPFFYNTRGAWGSAYAVIKNANFILSKLPDAKIDNVKKSNLTAEARFLRGYAYFYLVQMYGDVPLRTKPVEDPNDVQLGRTNQDSIYQFILKDLDYAETNLPDYASQQGRVYKLVATALLAKVYLTMAGSPLKQTSYYANARDEALKVINSGRFALLDDYSKVFHNTSYTTESIWEKLYVIAKGGNPVHVLTATAVSYKPILVPANWFTSSFAKGDQRKIWGIQQNYKDPQGNILPSFFQKFVNDSLIDAGLTAASPGVIVSYTLPYLRLAEMYLIAAEAENEINGPANAYQYINKIRWRARIDKADPTDVPDLSGLTQDQFRQAVWVERKWELYLEGSSWFDMKRTNTFQRIQDTRGSGLINPIGTYNQTWLIPDNEVVNNNIPQNPTY